jgi:hypothetical protein
MTEVYERLGSPEDEPHWPDVAIYLQQWRPTTLVGSGLNAAKAFCILCPHRATLPRKLMET